MCKFPQRGISSMVRKRGDLSPAGASFDHMMATVQTLFLVEFKMKEN